MFRLGQCLVLIAMGCAQEVNSITEPIAVVDQGPGEHLVDLLDIDGDHVISQAEFSAVVDKPNEFQSWDRDGSGGMDAKEVVAMLWRAKPSISREFGHGHRVEAPPSWTDWARHAQLTEVEWQIAE